MFINIQVLRVAILLLGIVLFGWGFYSYRRHQLNISISHGGRLVDSTSSLVLAVFLAALNALKILAGYFVYMAALFLFGVFMTNSAIIFSLLSCLFNLLLLLPAVISVLLANKRNELDMEAMEAMM